MKKLLCIILCLVFLLSFAGCAGNTPAQSGSSSNNDSSSSSTGSGNNASSSNDSSSNNNSSSANSPAPAGDSAPGSTTAVKDSLVLAFPLDPGNLAPSGTNSAYSDFVTYQIYDSLYDVSDATAEVIPRIMERYELSEDGKTYTFYLKQGIKDTNGNEITASDVLFSFKLCSESPMAINTMVVDFDESGVVDTYTFRLVTKSSGKVYLAQFSKIYIVSEDSYNASPDGFITTPVGTGPYKLESWTQGSSIKYVSNENYWDGAPAIKNLEFKIIGEPSQRTTALMTGEVDLVYEYLVSDAEYISGTTGYITENRATNHVHSLTFNCDAMAIGNDINFRRAVCLALDNVAITQVVYFGLNEPATTSESRSCYDYDVGWEGSEFYKYDVNKAKEYLEKSGYDGSTLTLITLSDPTFVSLSETISYQLKQQLGIETEIVQYEPTIISTIVLEQPENWSLYVSEHSTPENYGIAAVNNYHVRRNYPHLDDDLKGEFAAVCSVAMSTTNEAERKEYTQKAMELTHDTCGVYSVCYTTLKLAYAEGITNIKSYGTNMINFSEVVYNS